MSFFQRLFGGRKKPQFDERIIKAVLAFINAPTWEERRREVAAHRQELFSEFADLVFQGIMEQTRHDPQATQMLE